MIDKYRFTRLLVASIMLIIIIRPVLAQDDPSSELDSVDWLNVIESVLKFFADILEKSAQILRHGIDTFIELFGSGK